MSNALNITSDGIQIFDSSLGAFTSIDLTTKGDIISHDGASSYQIAGAGSDSQVLKADSSQTAGLRWASFGDELISSQTASASSSIDFTSFEDSDKYAGYILEWKNIKYSGSAPFGFVMQFSVDNGSSWIASGYKYCRNTIRNGSNDEVFLASSSSSSIVINGITGSGTYTAYWNGIAYFFPSTDASNYFKNSLVMETAGTSNTTNKLITSRGNAISATTSAVNGFRFKVTTGNIASGTFHLWGTLKEVF